MKKFYPLLAFLLVVSIAGLYGLERLREIRADQRAQTAHLLSRCVNQGLLSLFALQANDWRARPDFHREQEQKLNAAVAELPAQLLDGHSFGEWQAAVEICEKLTRHSNIQHQTIFRPLGQLASRAMSDSATLKDGERLVWRKREIYRAKVAAQAAERYLEDLHSDIESQLAASGLSAESRAQAKAGIQAEVLDHYRRGNFSRRRVEAHLDRMQRYYELLVENPGAYTLRGGSLFFHDAKLRREVDNLNSALLQGEAEFYGNWQQILQRQQIPVR